jgi:hypothetical protein
LEIQDLRAIIEDGWTQVLVVAVNTELDPSPPDPYTGTSHLDLTAEITEEAEELAYNSCGVMVDFFGHYHYEVNLPDTSYSYDGSGDGTLSTSGSYTGSFSGDTFTGSYVGSSGTVTITGTVTTTLNPSRTVVTSVDWSEVWSSPDFTQHRAFSGTNIPVDYTYYQTIIFQIEGEQTINHISSLTHTQTAPEGLSYSLTSYACTWDSRIWISLSEE